MLFGQTDEEGGSLIDSITANIGDQFDKAVSAVKEASLPWSNPSDAATSTVGSGKRSAGNRVQPEAPSDAAEATGSGPSVWPWLLGAGLLAGGAYLVLRRKKRGKRR